MGKLWAFIQTLLSLVSGALRNAENKGRREATAEAQTQVEQYHQQVQEQVNTAAAVQKEQAAANVEKADAARTRLDTDPEYAERVRSQFTRD